MIFALLSLLICAGTDQALAAADALAKQARAAEDPAEKQKQAERALDAYAAVIEERPKDLKLVPRVRRRRASLLRHLGRTGAALREYDAIVDGRARRKDKARALVDGAKLLERAGDLAGAEKRLARVLDDYRSIVRTRADAAWRRGRVLESMGREREAERAYRFVVEKCRDQVKPAIAAYDALALLAVRAGDFRRAQRWLRRCRAEYEKRAARSDRFGAYVGRLLGDMKAPRELGKAQAAARAREKESAK
jgi:tetratricopeptide (TPR) repeat protein